MRQSLAAASLYRIRVEVDFEALQDVLLFWRGATSQHQTVKSWFGLRSRENEFINYDRVLLFIHFKPDAWIADRNRVPVTFQPGTTAIKLFRDVPGTDLEMLFPNTEVLMRPVDKLMSGIPAAVTGALLVSTKLGGHAVALRCPSGVLARAAQRTRVA